MAETSRFDIYTKKQILAFAKKLAVLRRNFLEGRGCHEGLYELLTKDMGKSCTEWMPMCQPMTNTYNSPYAIVSDARNASYIPENRCWGTREIDEDVRLRVAEGFLKTDDSLGRSKILLSNLWHDFSGKFVFARCDIPQEYHFPFYEIVVAPNSANSQHRDIQTHGNILGGGYIEWKKFKVIRLEDQSEKFPLPDELFRQIRNHILRYQETGRLLPKQQSCLALYQIVADPYRYWDDIYVPPAKRCHDMLHHAASEILCYGIFRHGQKLWKGDQDFKKWLDTNA